jgi:hypothetical protein
MHPGMEITITIDMKTGTYAHEIAITADFETSMRISN